MSLGVDLVPHKVCSLDCVYCECGQTTLLTTERKEYIPYQKVVDELKEYFQENPDPDYITFSGAGEPTLNLRIGDVLDFIKEIKPHIPVAVLTNGTLLWQEKVRKELAGADLVLPSLDAASQLAFKKINRPDTRLNIEKHIQGLVDFRKTYAGKIWLEIFILPGYNDSPEEKEMLRRAVEGISPDRIQLNTLDRPGTAEGLKAADQETLESFAQLFDPGITEVIADPASRKEIKSYREDTEAAILETIYRRPCTALDLATIMGTHINEVNKYLDVLEGQGKIISERKKRGVFYLIKNKADFKTD